MAHIEIRGDYKRATVKVHGQELRHVKAVNIDMSVGQVDVTVELIGTAVDFDAEGRFVPLIDLVDADTYEEEATRDLYERLKARFEGNDQAS